MSRISEFLEIFAASTTEEQDKLCKFYLHNYVIPGEIEWSPLIFVGDIHNMALASYYGNDQLRGEIMEEYEEKEKSIALPIRREAKDSDAIIDEWMKLLTHKGVGKKIMKLKEEDYDRIKMLVVGGGQQCYKYVQNIWNNLTPKLQKKEPHSMHNFIAML